MAAQAHQMDKFYLDPSAMTLTPKKPSGPVQLKFAAMGDGLVFLTPPLAKETEITGPSALKLFVSSSTPDADIFVVLRVFTGDLKRSYSRVLSIRTPRSRKDGCAHRTANSTKNCRSPTAPTIRTIEAAPEERPASGARH